MEAYNALVKKKGFTVAKSLIIALDFSDDVVKEGGLGQNLNLSVV